jgi:ATP-binding cassette, subfamily A (ABC1), member 3
LLYSFSGIFDTVVVKNVGIVLVFQQFYALLLKRILNSTRNYLVLISSLLPVLFALVSLIIEQQIPKPEDSPALMISFDRYRYSSAPYSYNRSEPIAVDFIHSYENALEHSRKAPIPIDLTTNDTRPCQRGDSISVTSYLACIGRRSLTELSDRYFIGVTAAVNRSNATLTLTGYFNNQPYHVPPLTLNYLTNALLKQYSSTSMNNRTINVINHPVDR